MYIIAGILALVGFVVFFRIINLQTSSSSDAYRELAQNQNFRKKEILAARGNLYSSDGVLLATTVLKYDIAIDFKTIKKGFFDENIHALSDSLSKVLNQPSSVIESKFKKLKKRNVQYYRLFTNIEIDLFSRLKNFPIFKEGKIQGGFIVDRNLHRVRPIEGFGERTLGFDDERGKAGIEGAAHEYIKGKNGFRHEQRITAKQWKPINDGFENIEPIDGNDVVSTIDTRVQDITYNALEKQLTHFQADHGCAIVMEVSTGRIISMANLKRQTDGTYLDNDRNYAVWEKSEPGSTFKVVTMLAAMDDGYIDDATTIGIGNGVWKFYGKEIHDETVTKSVYNIEDILANSSNVGTARIIHQYYGKEPVNFLRKIESWNIHQKTGIEIPGESTPIFPSERLVKESKLTMPWMSFGYNINLTPLQLLNVYNAIANNGILVRPRVIDRIESKGIVVKNFETQIINPKIASDSVRDKMIRMLTSVVERGTSRSIFTPNLSMAGKTGTTQLEYWKHKGLYQSSFCGFFPADNPKYSCIVMVYKPDATIGYYGGSVAAPVFKEIAGKVFLKTPLNVPQELKSQPNYNINHLLVQERKSTINETTKTIPNLVGMYGKDVIPKLENLGVKIKFIGNGKIIKQSLPQGFRIKKGITLYLELA